MRTYIYVALNTYVDWCRSLKIMLKPPRAAYQSHLILISLFPKGWKCNGFFAQLSLMEFWSVLAAKSRLKLARKGWHFAIYKLFCWFNYWCTQLRLTGVCLCTVINCHFWCCMKLFTSCRIGSAMSHVGFSGKINTLNNNWIP